MLIFSLLFLTALTGFTVTRLLARYSVELGLLQVPNSRSSHRVPTPSGGGVAIAIAVVACGIPLALCEAYSSVFWLWLVLGAAMAGLGLVDDVHDIRPEIRFPIQIVLVSCATILSLPLPDLQLFLNVRITELGLTVVLVFACVWWINLFNFMDGIDGLAGSQSMIILGGALALWLWGDPAAMAQPVFGLGAVTFAACFGFTVNNWPPARIFMGDAGSNFLALVLLVVLLGLVGRDVLGYGGVLALVAVFVSDSTVTLLRRIARGERPWAAHRRHAYQQLSRRFGHKAVTISYGLLTLAWALPLSILASAARNLEWIIAGVAIAPLIVLAVLAGAGAKAEI